MRTGTVRLIPGYAPGTSQSFLPATARLPALSHDAGSRIATYRIVVLPGTVRLRDDAPGSATGDCGRDAGNPILSNDAGSYRTTWTPVARFREDSRGCRSGTFADRLTSPGRCSGMPIDAHQARDSWRIDWWKRESGISCFPLCNRHLRALFSRKRIHEPDSRFVSGLAVAAPVSLASHAG